MSLDLSHLDLVALQIDGLYMHDDDGMPMLGAVGVETNGPVTAQVMAELVS